MDGVCYAFLWKSRSAQTAFGICYFLSFYVVILAIFFFFYWRILLAVRRQAGVMAAHSVAGGPSAAQSQSRQIQISVIKTMILVSVLFGVTSTPVSVYFLLLNVHSELTVRESAFYAINFIGHSL